MKTIGAKHASIGAAVLLGVLAAGEPGRAQTGEAGTALSPEELESVCPGCAIEVPDARSDPVNVPASPDPKRPFVVKIHADWCMTCLMLDFTWRDLRREVGDLARFVVLDVTDRDRLEKARSEAERLGLRAFLDANLARTGTVGILHGASRVPIAVLTGETDTRRYHEPLERARRSPPSDRAD